MRPIYIHRTQMFSITRSRTRFPRKYDLVYAKQDSSKDKNIENTVPKFTDFRSEWNIISPNEIAASQ